MNYPASPQISNELNESDMIRVVGGADADLWSDTHVAGCERLLGSAICRRLGIFRLPDGFILSVIVPVYNEVSTVDRIVRDLRQTGLPMQIILVDDGSDDGSAERLSAYAAAPDAVVITHAKNRGKGAAIRTGLAAAQGDIVVIQDADQEYDPQDFRYLMQPILERRADVVYGTRYGHADRQVSPLWHELVNSTITRLANVAIGIRLNDIETCYKMASREAWLGIAPQLRENRFGIEIEVTARWARRRMRFVERPIRYQHRWYAEGKKIGWRDGVAALFCIVRYGLLRR
jgi:glycosyltransferase involved in cell wall biosynthesis